MSRRRSSDEQPVIAKSDGLPARNSGKWAKDKLAFLKTYINIFTNGMKNKWEHLVYIDLFAGPGKCIIKESGEEFDGSPLIAQASGTPFSSLYFVEENEGLFSALSKRIGPDSRCKILKTDCNTAVNKILSEKQSNTLYLTFIDHEGLHIYFDTLHQLCKGLQCDLLINFWISALTRNRKQWIEKGESQRLTKFFGTSEWNTLINNSMPETRICNEWVNLYKRRLQKIGYLHQANPEIFKNSIGAEMYWLWFASKHPRGLDFWKKAVKSASDGQQEFNF